jgi:hypothetical protein
MCRVHKDAGVLWRDDRLDDVGDVIYVREGFDAEEDVVEGLLGRLCGIFRGPDDYGTLVAQWSPESRGKHTGVGLKPLIAVQRRPGECQQYVESSGSCGVLERDAVLGNIFVSRLPHESDIAGICCL